jgi:hypothetical protein
LWTYGCVGLIRFISGHTGNPVLWCH